MKNDDNYLDVYTFLNSKGEFSNLDCDLFCLEVLFWCFEQQITIKEVPILENHAFYTCGFPIEVLNLVWEAKH